MGVCQMQGLHALAWACLLFAVLPSAARADCQDDYLKALVENEQDESEEYKKCYNVSVIVDDPMTTQQWRQDRKMSARDCFHDCLRFGLQNVSVDVRTPADAVKAAFVYSDYNPSCYCLVMQGGREIPTDSSCSADSTRKYNVLPTTTYNIPLQCALRDRGQCGEVSGCEYYNKCCYMEGTTIVAHEWMQKQLLQWVFLVVAVLFTGQLLMFCVLSCFAKLKRYLGYTDDGELGVGLLSVTPEKYRSYLEGLPAYSPSMADTTSACTICLDDLVAPSLGTGGKSRCVSLPDCEHKFHLACIQEYCCHEAQKQTTALCPNCRVKIDPTADDEPTQRRLFWCCGRKRGGTGGARGGGDQGEGDNDPEAVAASPAAAEGGGLAASSTPLGAQQPRRGDHEMQVVFSS